MLFREDVNKVLITGTGKSGTTFLVHLLTALEFDTGFNLGNLKDFMIERSFGGLEIPIRGKYAQEKTPYIIKNP